MDHHEIDICVIEDDPSQRALLVRALAAMSYRVVEADSGYAGLQAIYHHRPCIVICDINLPELSGIQICERIRADHSFDATFFILMTADHGEEKQLTAFDVGADEYLTKPYDLHQLRARIRSGMRFHRLQDRLKRAAITDGLTGLWNHSHFRELIDREFLRSRRYGGGVSLVMLDLDHFKAVNDTYGHETGNSVLQQAARHLERNVRETDLVARYGGEEFAIVCPETPLEEAAQLAERIRKSMPQQIRIAEQPQLIVRASFGVASTEDPRVHSVTDLVNLSDQSLYVSKRTGRNKVTVCSNSLSLDQIPELRIDEVDRLRKEIVALTMQTKELCLQSVWALIQALEARDGYSAWHSRNVTLYSKWLVEEAGWPRPQRIATTNAAMLHDLGKIGISDNLLLKPRALSPEEAAVMRQVPLITCRILEPLRVFETEILIIRHLRERYDGSGYPDGLSGMSIPIGSRVLAVAEAFDSITCNRAFRPGRPIDQALEILREESGRQFDPDFVELIGKSIERNPARWQNRIDKARIDSPADVMIELE